MILGRAASIDVLLALLLRPAFRLLVVLPDFSVELPRDPADRALVADVGRAETTGRQAAEELRRLDQHGRLPHPRRLNRRRDTSRGAAVDYDIERRSRRA